MSTTSFSRYTYHTVPGRSGWPNRDPLGDWAFFCRQSKWKTRQQQQHLGEMANLPSYLFVMNEPESKVDAFGLTDYNAQKTFGLLSEAYSDAIAGPIQGLNNIKNNSIGKFDYKVFQPDDNFCVNGKWLSAAGFGNYIAGFGGQAYDDAYPYMPSALAMVAAAGIVYHTVDAANGTGATSDALDYSGGPDINAGAQGAHNIKYFPIKDCPCKKK